MGIPLTIAMHRKNLNYSSLRFYDLLVVFVSFFAILQRCNRKMHQWISIALDFLKKLRTFSETTEEMSNFHASALVQHKDLVK